MTKPITVISVTSHHQNRNTRYCQGCKRDRTWDARPIATRTRPHTVSADTSHTALTHLGEQGASLLMLMAKSRQKKPENVRRYFKPSAEAIAELTSLLAPGDRTR
jgi:hypothetical protein